jgi:hypothetical protein
MFPFLFLSYPGARVKKLSEPPYVNSSQSFPMEAELNINVVGWHPSPGPADYVDRSHFGEALAWSMRSRVTVGGQQLDPSYVRLRGDMGQGLKFSLQSRQPPLRQWSPPGPNYVLPPFGRGCRSARFSPGKARKPPETPGPADYKIHPASVHGFGVNTPRTSVREGGPRLLWTVRDSPGPAVYKPLYEKPRDASPRWTIKNRFGDRAPERTGEYVKQSSTLSRQSWSFNHAGRPLIIHA